MPNLSIVEVQNRLSRGPLGLGFVSEPSPAQIKDVDTKKGIVVGYHSSFEVMDSYRDVMVPGCYKKTIKEWGPEGRGRIAHLTDHVRTNRVGVHQSLVEDSFGLRFESKLLGQGHSKGRDALIEYEEGAIKEHSVGFNLTKWEYDSDNDVLRILEVQLYEGSAVTWGANMETPVVDVKQLRSDPFLFDQLGIQLNALQRCVRRELTDERCIQLEARIEDFKSLFGQVEKALRAEIEPRDRTLSEAKPLTKDEALLQIAAAFAQS